MTSTIPACRDCKYYGEEMDFPVCKFHYIEDADYVNGNVYKINLFCFDVRKNSNFCGHEGKNFEQKEIVEETEERFSYWQYIKGFFTKQWMF